jgi:Zn-finger nucleic acid-binding protein
MPDPAAEDPPVRAQCPRCAAALRKVSMDRGASVHACGCCGGMFVAARAWCMFLERPDLVTAVEHRLPKRGPAPAALVPLVTCACCGAQMERGRFAASSGVVVDVCPRHGVWLDRGELAHVAAYARSPSRFEEAPAEHPVVVAMEHERRRIQAQAAKRPRKPPRPLWMKVLPVLLFSVGIAARWYYVQKLAAEQGVSLPEQGADVRQAGEEGYKALGGR